jgi:hypothetical protein
LEEKKDRRKGMEEDIKILETFKNQTFLYGRLAITQEAHKSISIAIENLIKGYRELEEKIEKQELAFVKGYTEGGYNQLNVMASKIKDILDWYSFTEHNKCLNIPIKVLQELLGDEK